MADNSLDDLKKKILLKISLEINKSSNLRHTMGTTQTTTNILDQRFKTTTKDVERTTRYIHQKQVSDQARDIVRAISGPGESGYQEVLAVFAGRFHDIGHCTYGHDGEAKINDFTQSFTSSLTDERRTEIKGFRDHYFSYGENNYETQQDWQNELIGQQKKGNTLIFDHGEESALAIINICESIKNSSEFKRLRTDPQFEDAYKQVQQDLTQCALMHSRPAFDKANHASEAVAIADSVAFIQDDLEQALLAHRLSSEDAQGKCKSFYSDSSKIITDALSEELGGVDSVDRALGIEEASFENFLSLTPEERRKKVTEEIVKVREDAKAAGEKDPPLRNGKHLDDIMWYAEKIDKSRADYVDRMVDLLKRGGYKEGENDKWSVLCAKTISNMKKPGTEPKVIESKVKALLELKYKMTFPVNYRCYVINKAVINNELIYGKNLGNNTTKDGASTKFMLLSLYKGYIYNLGEKKNKPGAKDAQDNAQKSIPATYDEDKKLGEDENSPTKSQFAAQKCTFYDFFQQMRTTPEFQKLKAIILSGHEFKGLSKGETPSHYNKEQNDLEVFKRLGFHVGDLRKRDPNNPKNSKPCSQGILDQYSPVQLIAKMVEGMTNEFSRTYTRYLQKDMTIDKLNDMGMLEITPAEPQKDKPDGRHLTPQDLLGLGYTTQQVKDYSERLKAKNQSFTQEDVWGTKHEAVEFGIAKFDEDIIKQVNSLGTEITDEEFKKAQAAYVEIDNIIKDEDVSTATKEKVKALRHKLCVNLSKKIDIQNKTVEFDEKEGIKAVEEDAPAQTEEQKEDQKSITQSDVEEIKSKITPEKIAENPDKILDELYEYVQKKGLSSSQITAIYKQLASAVKEIQQQNMSNSSGKAQQQALEEPSKS